MVQVPRNVERVAYRDDERAFPVVGTPYIGKSYPQDTEVTSLGFEGLASGHAAFDAYMNHPEAFLFVLGALQAPADPRSTPMRLALGRIANAVGWR
jgi:hypothetical protein